MIPISCIRTRFVLLLAALTLVGLAFTYAMATNERSVSPVAAEESELLLVHEWGTFTALQDENGDSLAGVNVDDEPAPNFVHGFGSNVLLPPDPNDVFRSVAPLLSKKMPRWLTLSASVRLETPVIYFHLPDGVNRPVTLDVEVDQRGGWLSEFYPKADFTAPGLQNAILTPSTRGTLAWRNLQVGTERTGPETSDKVWLAPRDVDAATVTSAEGESEKFLFYRGLGNYPVPLRVSTNLQTNELTVRSQLGDVLRNDQTATIRRLWLVDIRADGSLAYRTMGPLEATGNPDVELAKVSASFPDEDYASDKLLSLRDDMHGALVKDGLFADEAWGLLNTWEDAYFQSPGLRLFFLVPRAWTDYRLPLKLSAPARVERVMVGRIELIRQDQREKLAALSQATISHREWNSGRRGRQDQQSIPANATDSTNCAPYVPEDFQLYLGLGRFREALVLAELKRQSSPSPSLVQFAQTHRLIPPEFHRSTDSQQNATKR